MLQSDFSPILQRNLGLAQIDQKGYILDSGFVSDGLTHVHPDVRNVFGRGAADNVLSFAPCQADPVSCAKTCAQRTVGQQHASIKNSLAFDSRLSTEPRCSHYLQSTWQPRPTSTRTPNHSRFKQRNVLSMHPGMCDVGPQAEPNGMMEHFCIQTKNCWNSGQFGEHFVDEASTALTSRDQRF